MKLRNKKTGEIKEFDGVKVLKNSDCTIAQFSYDNLAEINEEWEDYEEPKEDYIRVIESFINYVEEADESFYCDESVKKFVEKLKAWKRLKDKGFRFIPEASYVEPKETGESIMFIACTMNDDKDFIYGDNKDLKLLFSGEDD